MNTHVRTLTHYLHEIQRRANLPDVAFTSDEPFCSIDLRSGRLPPETAAKLFKAGDKNKKKFSSEDKNKPLPIVLSLVTLSEGKKQQQGLLLLPAVLHRDGSLSADIQGAEPWIPASRLETDDISRAELRDVMVGKLGALWHFRNHSGLEMASQIENIAGEATTPEEKEAVRLQVWNKTLDYTFAMFEAVAGCAPEEFARRVHGSGEAIIEHERCLIQPYEFVIANRALLDLYKYLENNSADDALLYQRLLAQESPAAHASETIDSNDEDGLLASALLACGNMGCNFPLSDSQRLAIHAFLRSRVGDITAVSGPPGTGKTTMLQAAVANLIVRHALEGKEAPLIVGTSTNNQAVTNIIDSFTSVVKKEHGALDWRWLPRADKQSAHSQPLTSLAVYCPSGGKLEEAKKKYLVENTQKEHVYSHYSESGYLNVARGYFRDAAARFSPVLATPEVSFSGMESALGELLHEVDEVRCRLLRAAFLLGEDVSAQYHAAQQLAQQLRQKCAAAQESLKHWLAARDAMPRSMLARLLSRFFPRLFRADAASETAYINMQRRESDDFPPQTATFDAVLAHYNQCFIQQQDVLNQLKPELNRLEEKQRARDNAQTEISHCINRLSEMNVLPGGEKDAAKLRACKTLKEMDERLDTTVRYAQFWLAVHMYEAHWLAVADAGRYIDGGYIEKDDRWQKIPFIMRRYWQQACCLTPCFVMTVFMLPRYFKQRKNKVDIYDIARIDLLIVDEAGQVDTSLGAATFALAGRALVVGDEKQLSPIWGIESQADCELAASFGLLPTPEQEKDAAWKALEIRGLTASNPSSLMRAASQACGWTYSDRKGKMARGLFLSEHRRCHDEIIAYCNKLLYDGLLKPCRETDTQEKYALKDLVEKTSSPFLFRVVENSEDRKVGSSRCNDAEADAVAQWVREHFDYFRTIYPDSKAKASEIIGIVTPFRVQARLIERKLREVCGNEMAKHITVGTAHTLQGAERPVILFSAVYGDNSPSAGFIDGTPNLMNVAVSRAKDLFIVFGARTRLEKDNGKVFELMRAHAKPHACRFSSM